MTTAKQKLQKAFQRKCPNCGAPLKFDPTSGKLACEHCKSLVDFEQSKDVKERDFDEMYDFTPWKEDEVSAYRCANCGASSVVSRTALATTCPFCSSPVVLDEKTTGLVRPDSLVPFELSEKDAATQLAAWKKHKVFAPNKFRKHTRAKSVKGVFVPVWTFDAETLSQYNGRLGKHKTRTVRRNGKTYTETYTDWFRVSGEMPAIFDDIMIAGSSNVEAKYFNEVKSIDRTKYTVYTDEYLAGYVADNYTVAPQKAYNVAQKIMDGAIRDKILRKYNADVVGSLDVRTTEISRSFKYMLFPVYVAATKFRGKVYNQYVSGFWTNRNKLKASVSGNFPKSGWKIFFTVLAAVAVVGGLVALLVYAMLHGGVFDDFWSGWEFVW
ncbi:MAG: TFIIB-type zinc ribbon-containing protein [Clostridiales bacterium]|nr:TFIIB-type zinc ribbon-containing protein [Clostridiales bacterium]